MNHACATAMQHPSADLVSQVVVQLRRAVAGSPPHLTQFLEVTLG
jgi:hypothetical protein